MKKLLLGNEAVARGLYEAGCGLLRATLAHRARKSRNMPLNMRIFTANGSK